MSMTPQQFIQHWHAVAKISPPRFFPDGWLRQAAVLMEKGISAEDLTLVAGWMRTQMLRSQNGERNSVAFNAASFGWVKMFGEFGASNQHENFLGRLTLAEATRPRAAAPVQAARKAAAPAVQAADEASRERMAAEAKRHQEELFAKLGRNAP